MSTQRDHHDDEDPDGPEVDRAMAEKLAGLGMRVRAEPPRPVPDRPTLAESGWIEDRYDAELRRLDRLDRRYAAAVTDVPEIRTWAEDALLGGDRWLLLAGPTGVGKTYQAHAALRIIGAAGGLAWVGDVEAEVLGKLRRLWPSEEAEEAMDELATAPLLFVDDLGAAKTTEWTEEVLYRVLNRRYSAMRPCLFTSNLGTERLREHLGDRLSSRIAEAATVVVLTGPDRRRA